MRWLTGEPRLGRHVCFECYPSYRDGVLYRAVSGQLENLTQPSMFRYCRVNGLGCREDRCVGWRTRLFVRCRARWWALGYRALVSPSLARVIRDRCPKPNTCRATALSGFTREYTAVTGGGGGLVLQAAPRGRSGTISERSCRRTARRRWPHFRCLARIAVGLHWGRASTA